MIFLTLVFFKLTLIKFNYLLFYVLTLKRRVIYCMGQHQKDVLYKPHQHGGCHTLFWVWFLLPAASVSTLFLASCGTAPNLHGYKVCEKY